MKVPDDARWIPMGVLPLDLQLELLQTESPVQRRAWRSREPNSAIMLAALLAGMIAGIHVMVVDALPGFGSPWRAGCLAVAALLTARYLLWRRGLGFRAEDGQQMRIGRASLIIAGPSTARVIPAEALVFVVQEIRYRNEHVGSFDTDRRQANWAEKLREVVEKAKNDPALRERDRYRRAAGRAPALSPAAAWWSLRETQLSGAALALCAVVFLEAGPLHARGQRALAQIKAAHELPVAVTDARQARAANVKAVKIVIDAEKARVKREEMLREALAGMFGRVVEARAFLADYPQDEARPAVHKRLQEACAAQEPRRAFAPPRDRMLHAALLGACATPGGVLYYATTGDPDFETAKAFAEELASGVNKMAHERHMFVAREVDKDAEGFARVQLAMTKLGPARTWQIDVTPLDALGKPVEGAAYQHRGLVRPR